MKHNFQIGEVVAPIGNPRGVKYVIIDTQPGTYSMYSCNVGYIVPIAPMLEIDRDCVKVGKWDFDSDREVEDDE